jgi:hypothetical protein
MLPIRKKHPPRQLQPQLYIDTRPNRARVVVIEPLEQPLTAPNPVRNPPSKNIHRKGKSVDIEEGKGFSREERKGRVAGQEAEARGKIVVDSDFLIEFRERGSISEMKQYNISKKLPSSKKSKEESSSQARRKKAKSTNEGEMRQIKKEIKSMFEATPLHLNKRKEGSRSSAKSSRSNSNCFSKPTKNSKSHDLNTERKGRHKSKSGLSELKNIAYTMPITSKMVSLYSNTSSLFSSKAELERVERRHSYVIPTEESIEEIPEIRKY